MPDTGLKDAEHGWCPVGGFPTTEQGYLKVVSVDEEGHKTVACPVCNRDLAMKVRRKSGSEMGVSRHKLLNQLAQKPHGPNFDRGNGKAWGEQGDGYDRPKAEAPHDPGPVEVKTRPIAEVKAGYVASDPGEPPGRRPSLAPTAGDRKGDPFFDGATPEHTLDRVYSLSETGCRLESLEELIVTAMQEGQKDPATAVALLPDIWQEIRAIKKEIP
jgi:hypothetical protein